MDTTPPPTASRQLPSRIPLSPMAAILLALSVGLCAGYLDVGVIIFRKLFWNTEGYFRTGRDFLWTVPVGHALLLLIPGLVVAAVTECGRDSSRCAEVCGCTQRSGSPGRF